MSYSKPRLVSLTEVDAVGNCAAGFNEDSMNCFDGLSD